MDINISSQIVVQTAAAWAADATVYSAKRILVTSDAYYGTTDQRKFKIADGVQTWSNLDYVPISQTLAEVLANGNSTGGLNIVSPNGNAIASIVNSYIYLRGGASNKGELYLDAQEADLYNQIGGFFAVEGLLPTLKYFKVTSAKNIVNHDVQVDYNTPSNNFPQETASRVAIFDASKNLKAADTATYPSLTELAYVKGVTSAIQTQINTKVTSGGALGTPSSGTLTNCTGLPISGIVGYEGYTLTAFHTTTNPADGAALYWGSDFLLAASSTANILRIYPPKAGTLKAVFLKTRCTAGSNEAVGISIIKNNTTTTSLGSIDLSVTQTNNIFSGLNISFNGTTDYLEMIYDATTWATNPTNLRGYAALYFE